VDNAFDIVDSLKNDLKNADTNIAIDASGSSFWTVKTLFPLRFNRIQEYCKNKAKDDWAKEVDDLRNKFFTPDYCKLLSETLNTGGVKSITHSGGTYYNPVTGEAVDKAGSVQDCKDMFERLRSLCKQEELKVAVNEGKTLGRMIDTIINGSHKADELVGDLKCLRRKLVLDYNNVMRKIEEVLTSTVIDDIKFSDITLLKDTAEFNEDIKTYWIPLYFEEDLLKNRQIFHEILQHAGANNDIKCYLWSTCLKSPDTCYLKSLLFLGHSGEKWNLSKDEVPTNAGLRKIGKLQCLGDLFLYFNNNTYDVLRKRKKIILDGLPLNPGNIQGTEVMAKIKKFSELFKTKYDALPSCTYVFLFTGVEAK